MLAKIVQADEFQYEITNVARILTITSDRRENVRSVHATNHSRYQHKFVILLFFLVMTKIIVFRLLIGALLILFLKMSAG